MLFRWFKSEDKIRLQQEYDELNRQQTAAMQKIAVAQQAASEAYERTEQARREYWVAKARAEQCKTLLPEERQLLTEWLGECEAEANRWGPVSAKFQEQRKRDAVVLRGLLSRFPVVV